MFALGTIVPSSGPFGTEVTVQIQDYPGDHTTPFAAFLGHMLIPNARVEQGETELVFDVPENAQSGVITLAVNAAGGQQTAQTGGQFTVEAGGTPRITLVQPQSTQPGLPITLTGTNLEQTENVAFKNAEGTVRYPVPTQVSSSRVRVAVPQLPAGDYTLGIRVTDGQVYWSVVSVNVMNG